MKETFYRKVIPIALTFTFMLTMLPTNLMVLAAKDNKPKKERKIVKEIVEKRTETSKVFLNNDGTYTVKAYQKPIHYKNGDKLEDIDNTLIKQEKKDRSGSYYKNKANKLNINLDERIDSDSPINIELDNYKIEMKPVIENTVKEKNTKEIKKNKVVADGKVLAEDIIDSLQYENVYRDTDIKYTPTDRVLKKK